MRNIEASANRKHLREDDVENVLYQPNFTEANRTCNKERDRACHGSAERQVTRARSGTPGVENGRPLGRYSMIDGGEFIAGEPAAHCHALHAGKTPSRNPYKAYALVGVEDANDMGRIAQILSSRKADNPASTQFTTMNMHQIIHTPKPASPALIAHSIKRGALNFLTAYAAQNQRKQKYIPLLAKHGDGKATMHNTIRYITEHVPLAKVIGTQKAT
ncbi:hypothetical protein ABB37_07121 [Leptomonas pyrrhocoris]|uniref:Uncharacterized protein n=1 Tax=Leptomonas pyrrhocoris TaxID=157538 RepID=A0A0N0DTA4_LEPPY|nr:hypothetical protein ABB37_07121 [Leptomonas pyrrhocoris]KPA77212.1 hypothetical protein ABB37_07121 [Leptomonas pyrrhocoris]|eukprot:XP_015655651.1 hypothetical protein ABB37_07121 [Leptomonas pyrrhocoris]